MLVHQASPVRYPDPGGCCNRPLVGQPGTGRLSAYGHQRVRWQADAGGRHPRLPGLHAGYPPHQLWPACEAADRRADWRDADPAADPYSPGGGTPALRRVWSAWAGRGRRRREASARTAPSSRASLSPNRVGPSTSRVAASIAVCLLGLVTSARIASECLIFLGCRPRRAQPRRSNPGAYRTCWAYRYLALAVG